jgi:flap endonuclease-1
LGVNLRGIANPKKTTLEEMRGRKLAIDAFNTLYQFLSIIRGMTGELLRDNKGRVTSHLSGLFYRNINLMETGITLAYVFDGEPPKLKTTTIERRREVKVAAAKMYSEALEKQDLILAKRYASATAYLTDEMVEESKKLLDLMGVPWIQAPSEGEATAAYMTTNGSVDYAASQDYDSLLFGAKRLIRNVTISGKRKLPNRSVRVDVIPETVELEQILSGNGITREQLIDIAVLLGTDFNPDGFEGIGPATALKLVKKYGRIEKIPQLKEKIDFDLEAIRDIFLKPKVARVEPSMLRYRDIQREGIVDFLCGSHDFSRERVESALNRLGELRQKESASLEQWFG